MLYFCKVFVQNRLEIRTIMCTSLFLLIKTLLRLSSMRKQLLFLLVVLLGVPATYAREIPADEALQNALRAMHSNGRLNICRTVTEKFQLVSTIIGQVAPLYYVYESDKSGFIMVSADTRTKPLLGYSDSGSYADALANPVFKVWAEQLDNALATTLAMPEKEDCEPMPSIPEQTFRSADGSIKFVIPERRYVESGSQPGSVAPLLGSIAWNQDEPYNNYCPNYSAGVRCLTGCVATALAQLMKYYEWPQTGAGSLSYVTETNGYSLSADFSQATYRWDKMLNTYGAVRYTTEQAASVAKLMRDVGIAVQMDYGTNSGTTSSAYNIYYLPAMCDYFRYDKSAYVALRSYYTSAEWIELLKSELAEGHPLLFSARNGQKESSHAFLIDGYDGMGLFHVNWGWGGMSNGYFDIDLMNPDDLSYDRSEGYSENQTTFIGMQPDRTGTSEAAIALFVSTAISCDVGNDNYNISYKVSNYGYGDYSGKAGFVAVNSEGKIIGQHLFQINSLPHCWSIGLWCTPQALNINEKNLGGDVCYVYPAYFTDEGEARIVRSKNSANQCLMIAYENGQITIGYNPAEIPALKVEHFGVVPPLHENDIVRLSATICNSSQTKEYSEPVMALVYDMSGKLVSTAHDAHILQPGKHKQYSFELPDVLPKGTYKAHLVYNSLDYQNPQNLLEGNNSLEFIVEELMPEATFFITYSDFKFSDNIVYQGNDISVTFNVTNDGDCSEHQYYFAYYKQKSFDWIIAGYSGMKKYALEGNGATTAVTVSAPIMLEPGNYGCAVMDNTTDENIFYDAEEGILHNFTVKAELSGINHIVLEPAAYAPAPVYDLFGRRVHKPVPGNIYIKNRKKFIARKLGL